MNTQSFYLIPDSTPECLSDFSTSFRVNCAGYVILSKSFSNSGKRPDWYLQVMDCGELTDSTIAEGRLHTGQFIIRSPGTYFHYSLPTDQPMGYYWIHFTGSEVEHLLQQFHLEPNRAHSISDELPSSIRQEFSFLFREFMFRQQGYQEMTASLATSILIKLGRFSSHKNPEELRNRLEVSTEYIHEHYTENLKITSLAAMEHLCESRFRELFREAFGLSPNDYIIQLRLNHAADLLTISDLSISEIAGLCGYTDALYFSRLFRKKNGIAPGFYRRNFNS